MTEPRFVPLSYEALPADVMRTRAAEFEANLQRRRTVRQFSDQPVPRSVIERCLLAAGTAPSGAHQQPWHFVARSRRSCHRHHRRPDRHPASQRCLPGRRYHVCL